METNLRIRRYIHALYHGHKPVAKSRACSFVESLKLDQLPPAERVTEIVRQLELLQRKMDGFAPKEYLDFADDERHLFNYFAGRLYFYSHDEGEKLLEGMVLNEIHHLLSKLLLEAMAQMPLFTMAGFMNNDPNVVFYVLNRQPFGTSDEDYAAMRGYQARMKLECVDLESNLLVARLIESVSGLAGNLDLARAEMDKVEFLLGNGPAISPEEYITKLFHLRAFPPGAMPENIARWHESLSQFLAGDPMPYALSPCSLQLALGNIQAGKIAPAPLCVWSLRQYKKWLDDLLQGKIDLDQRPEHSLEKLFEKNLTVAPLKSKVIISKFNNKKSKSHEKS